MSLLGSEGGALRDPQPAEGAGRSPPSRPTEKPPGRGGDPRVTSHVLQTSPSEHLNRNAEINLSYSIWASRAFICLDLSFGRGSCGFYFRQHKAVGILLASANDSDGIQITHHQKPHLHGTKRVGQVMPCALR